MNKYAHPDPNELMRLKEFSFKKAIYEYTKKDIKTSLNYLFQLLDIFNEISGYNDILENSTQEKLAKLEKAIDQFKNNISIQKIIGDEK